MVFKERDVENKIILNNNLKDNTRSYNKQFFLTNIETREIMEFPETQFKTFSGKKKDVLQEMKDCMSNMIENYPFEDSKQIDVPKEMRKVREKRAQKNDELKAAASASKETQDKIKAEINIFDKKLNMLTAINELEAKILDVEDIDSDNDVNLEEVDIFIVEAQKQEPEINSVFEQCKTQFSVAQKMPTSFEKSLMTINYCLSLLTQGNQADELLGLQTKDQILERLREELKKILILMEREKVGDYNLKVTINRVVTQFMSNVPTVQECIQALSELVSYLKQIRPFFFQEFFDLIETCDKNSLEIKNKTIILLLGTTGCGKSTTIQYLSGAEMAKRNDGHIQAKNMTKDIETFIASSAARSITRYINPFKMTYTNNYAETENIVIVDTPGFGDTQGLEVDISNSIGIIRAVGHSTKVFPVIIFNEKNQGGRCELMKEQICFYQNMIKGMNVEGNNQVNFFFSHYNEGIDIVSLIRRIVQDLNHQEQLNIGLVTVLKKMRELGEQGKLHVLNPLDKLSGNVLNKILSTTPIHNPRQNFNLAFKESSKLSLQKQVGLHEQFILDSLNNKEVEHELISHKIIELQKFAQIIKPYDNTYNQKVEELSNKIDKFVKDEVQSVKQRASQCMDHGNILADQDITSFKEALEFERNISPLLQLFNQQDNKVPADKIQSDQGKLPEIIQTLLSKGDTILFQLFNYAQISDDKWFVYLDKAGKLAQQINGCEKLKDIALEKYFFRLKEQSIQAEDAINQTNIGQISSAQPSSNIMQQEEIKGAEQQPSTSPSNLHEKYASSLINLYLARDKAKKSNNDKIAEELEKMIVSTVNKLNDLDKIIKPHFNLCVQDIENETYMPFNAEHIKNINLAFLILNNYYNSCQQISTEIGEKLSTFQINYTQMCVKVVKDLKNKIKSLLQKAAINESQTKDIKSVFDQIQIVQTITCIQNETKGTQKEVLKLMENRDTKKEIIENLNELCNYAIQNISIASPGDFKKGIEEKLKTLNESLKGLKILEITYQEPSKYKEQVLNEIVSHFNQNLEKINMEGDVFVTKIEEKYQYLVYTAYLYDIIQEIYKVASAYQIDVQKDFGQNQVALVKNQMLNINQQSIKSMGKLMVMADYKILDEKLLFLKQFSDGLANPIINKFFKAIQLQLQDPQDPPQSIDPRNIVSYLNKLFPPQFKFLKNNFDESLSKLKTITTTKNYEDKKLDPEQFQKEVQEHSEKILKIFKLAHDIKNRYPQFIQKILEEDHPDDEKYISSYFSGQLRDNYLNELEIERIQDNRLWIYLKLESMKQLKELDNFIIPTGIQAQQSYQNLYKKYFLNSDQEIQGAQERFQRGEYSKVAELLNKLEIGIVNENAQKIIDKTIEYINFQTNQLFETLNNKKDAEKQLNNETAKYFAQQSEMLLKIHVSLGQFIKIRGKTIILTIISQIIPYLDECFKQYAEDIEITLHASSYQEALDKIDTLKQLSNNLQQDAGNELKSLEKFISLYDSNTKLVQDSKSQVLASIKEVGAKIISRDSINAQRIPQAKVFYAKISHIQRQPQIQTLTEKFIDDLQENYDRKCLEISEKLKTKNDEEIEKVRKEAKQVLQSLNYMPSDIKESVAPKINEFFEIYDKKLQEELKQIDHDVEVALRTNIDPIKFSNDYLIKYRGNQINTNLSIQIKTFLQSKVRIIVTKIYEQLDQKLIDLVITNYLPQMNSYINDYRLSEFIFSEFNEIQQGIHSRIYKLFNDSIFELSQFFQRTHNKSGDWIQSKFLSQDKIVSFPDQTMSIRILRDLIKNRDSQYSIISECVPDLIDKLNAFFVNSSKYLKETKLLFINSQKMGQIQESFSALNNLKFTNQLLNSDFIQLLNEILNISPNESKELLNDIQNINYDKFHEEIITQLRKSQEFILNCSFIDKHRSTKLDLEKFYKTFYNHYDQIMKGSQTEERSPINDRSTSQISAIFNEVQMQFSKYMAIAKRNVSELNTYIQNGKILTQEQMDDLNSHYNSLSQMEKYFIEHRIDAEELIVSTKKTLQLRLFNLENEAKNCYDVEQPSFDRFAKILSTIQQMSENMNLFQDLIIQSLDSLLNDFSEKNSKDSNPVEELQIQLESQSDSYGPNIAKNHPTFFFIKIDKFNKILQQKPVKQVLKELYGTDLNDNEKEALETFFNEYLTVYMQIVNQKLDQQKEKAKKNLPIDLSDIKANIKQKFSSENKRKWVEMDIFELIKFGNPVTEYKKLVFLLANIFAMWTLMNSQHYQKAQQQDGFQANLQNYLLQPHSAQIFSILRIVGLGYSSKYLNGPQFNTSWTNYFDQESNIRNNLVQIKTGEGKSITLAVLSILFALNGFEVKCACYSKYLSQRDYESFESLFRELDLQDLIKYGTFHEVAEMQINREGDIREVVKALVLQDNTLAGKPAINLNDDKRPQILLIDEVDMILDDSSFFGHDYIPSAEIRHEAISILCDYIWEERQKKIEELALMTEEKQKEEKQKNPYMSFFNHLKDTKQYQDVQNLFKPDFQYLAKEFANMLIVDVVAYESHTYQVHEGLIGYQQSDSISTNTNIGYQTLFAYYQQHREKNIEENVLNSKKAILINCAKFQFTEAPLDYNLIVGVTGTLDTLSEPQKDVLKNIYCIEHSTFSPSVYSSDISRVFKPMQDVIIIRDSNEYYRMLVNEMESKYLKNDRPVILFFENNEQLDKFAKSEEFKNKNYQIIDEKDSQKEKANKVLKATQLKQITLSTKKFGRGTDFICYDNNVISKNGLVVIQTFLSENLSEETQIRGRTARQGGPGTYIMFLNLVDLSKFNIELQEIEESKNEYQTLCKFREKFEAEHKKETTKMREEKKESHDTSTQICRKMKKIVQNNGISTPEELQEVQDHLLQFNKATVFEFEVKTEQKKFHPIKVLVLIDCTGSMSMTLSKTKNCVDKVIQEAGVELAKRNLSQELILIKIAGYRNYSSLEQKLFQASEWTSNSNNLTNFLQNTLSIHGGQGNEAIEIGLQYANREIDEPNGIPLSMIIIIGDAPPNTIDDVRLKREGAANSQNDPLYWQKTRDYKEPTHWQKEIELINQAKVPVHTFYVLNDKIAEKNKQLALDHLASEFKKISGETGKCQFLDIHDEEKGQEQLKNLFLYYIVHRIVEINYGKEIAMQAVEHIPIESHT